MTTSRWGVDCILSKSPFGLTHTRSVVESLPWRFSVLVLFLLDLEKALGSNPADCPISCLYLPSQALVTPRLPFRKKRLAVQEL